MRVLLVKTSSMGDMIHTLPALTDAKRNYPQIIFDWVAEEAFTEIPAWHSAVERVIPVAIRRWRKSWFSAPTRQERTQFLQQLQQQHYDAVIDAQGLLKSALLVTRHAKGVRHGYAWQSAREPLASLFYQQKHLVSKQLHAVERSRQLFAQSLGYQVSGEGDFAIAQHFQSQQAVAPYVVFLHATTRDNKHWPEEHWRKLIACLAKQQIGVKLPWGAPHEQARAQRLAAGFSHVDVLPKLSLSDVAGVLANAQAVVSVDTGLSHLAAALAKPNILLCGPTDPKLIGGYGQNQFVCQSPDHTMASITAERVYQMLQPLLTQAEPGIVSN